MILLTEACTFSLGKVTTVMFSHEEISFFNSALHQSMNINVIKIDNSGKPELIKWLDSSMAFSKQNLLLPPFFLKNVSFA